MRTVLACLLVVVSSLAIAQTSTELHSRYGDSDRERFRARPGISLTVQYGSDGLACLMLLESPRFLFNSEEPEDARYGNVGKPEPPSSMPPNEVTEVLEEVIPLSSRGAELNHGITESGRNSMKFDDYENVIITHAREYASQQEAEREMRVTVMFKRDLCMEKPTSAAHWGQS